MKHKIKQIFQDHRFEYYEKHPDTPEYIIAEIEKMLNCRNPEKMGYHKYACPDHPCEYIVVPHSCKSRFCSVCGALQTDKWMDKALKSFPDTPYYHITLTMPDYLWYFFKEQHRRPLLKLIFSAGKEAILGWYEDNRKVIPAMCSALHTYGKKTNYNTHLHIIVSAGGLRKIKNKINTIKNKNLKNKIKNKIIYTDKKTGNVWEWKMVKIYWPALKKRWKAILLKKLSKYLDDNFTDMLKSKDWYLNVRQGFNNVIMSIKYIGRYCQKPAMAETRITNYDGQFVTFYYDEKDKEYNFKKREYITMPWEDFIYNLIQHIPLPNFRMVRSYGILSNRLKGKLLYIVHKLLGTEKNENKKTPERRNWRMRQIEYIGEDPFICKICGKEMVLVEVAYQSKKNNRLYIKNMTMELEILIQTKGLLCPKSIFSKIFMPFYIKFNQIFNFNIHFLQKFYFLLTLNFSFL